MPLLVIVIVIIDRVIHEFASLLVAWIVFFIVVVLSVGDVYQMLLWDSVSHTLDYCQ